MEIYLHIVWKLLIVIIIIILVSVSFTGYTSKRYSHLAPDYRIDFKGTVAGLSELAKIYKPPLKDTLTNDGLDWIWYEAYSDSEYLYISYFPSWKTETHPNFFLNLLYSIWRWFYYGSVRDAEFISVKVELLTGNIIDIVYQQPRFKKHGYVEHNDILYDKEIPTGEFDNPYELDGERLIVFEIISWNHLSNLVEADKSEPVFTNLPLRYLSDRDFRLYKFNRRSLPNWMK